MNDGTSLGTSVQLPYSHLTHSLPKLRVGVASPREVERAFAQFLGQLHAQGYLLIDSIYPSVKGIGIINKKSIEIDTRSACTIDFYLQRNNIAPNEKNIQRAMLRDLSGGIAGHIFQHPRYIDQRSVEATIRGDMYKAGYRSVEDPIIPSDTYFRVLEQTAFPAFRK